MINKPLRVLLVLGEQPSWSSARYLSYHIHVGMEDGLKAAGVEVTTLMSPLVQQAPKLLQGQKFDQIWVEVMTNGISLDVLEWLSTLAPVRVGLCAESTVYTEEELDAKPEFAFMLVRFRQRLKFLTHLLVGDEEDVGRLACPNLQTAWWLVSANRRFIQDPPLPLPDNFRARFYGHIYGERQRWLSEAALSDLITAAPSSEGKGFVLAYDFWQLVWRGLVKYQVEAYRLNRLYLWGARRFRVKSTANWHRHLQDCSAVVSLPLVFKSFPGRVTEAMAAGRAVLAWQVPQRPLMSQVFLDGEEILLYRQPEQLREHILRLRAEPSLAQQIATRATRRLLAQHTTEIRVGQILEWLATGTAPDYTPR
ncbi:MAG: glycosyltransferase family 1 protein [Candidatus Eremiobacteraeota bacterium]|nr:glycosyltransferase family 1 protein [Candidatus Eremiobacteraeota bacterium]MCW5868793.1 glycosyltransferase family 1 protein [Candidatus Eremiobacteraeota bacterium]